MATDRRIDGARTLDDAARQRLIVALDAARLQLPHQIGLRLERLGDHHQAAGVLVQAMHDAGPRHLVELRDVVQERIEQGAAPVAAARVNDQACRLVDHQQAIVLMDHLQRDILRRRRLGAFVRRLGEFDGFAGPELVRGSMTQAPSTATLPSRIQPCRRLRECCGSRRARI
jgi:hypothetical protein